MASTDDQVRWSNARLDVPRVIAQHKTAVIVGAAIAPLVTAAVLSALRDNLPVATNVLVLVLVVIAMASTGLRGAGIVAAVSAGLWFDYFLTQPYGQLAINDPDEVEAAVLLVVVGAAVTEVALWGHRQQARANRRAGYLDGVLGTAEIVTLSTESSDALTTHVAEQIKQVLTVSRCRFVLGPVLDPRIPLLGHQGQLTRLGKDVDVDRDGLPTDDDIALVVTRRGTTVGHFLVTSASHIARPTVEQRRVAVLLADQVGQVLGDPR
jgi:K+-sensing histidine kinase KdpD